MSPPCQGATSAGGRDGQSPRSAAPRTAIPRAVVRWC